MAGTEVWTVGQYLKTVNEHATRELDDLDDRSAWIDLARQLALKAINRGDGVAVYVNHDLGSSEIGQLQLASYGSEASQLGTRNREWIGERTAYSHFTHGNDLIPVTMPDIGGAINWRYQLAAIVPSYAQLVIAVGENEADTFIAQDDDRSLLNTPEKEDAEEEAGTYRIVRFYRGNRPKEVISTGHSLEEAQAHCNDESTHGSDWFDGFEQES